MKTEVENRILHLQTLQAMCQYQKDISIVNESIKKLEEITEKIKKKNDTTRESNIFNK